MHFALFSAAYFSTFIVPAPEISLVLLARWLGLLVNLLLEHITLNMLLYDLCSRSAIRECFLPIHFYTVLCVEGCTLIVYIYLTTSFFICCMYKESIVLHVRDWIIIFVAICSPSGATYDYILNTDVKLQSNPSYLTQ